MAKLTVADWDRSAGGNTDIGGINCAEGWASANINNAFREMMAQIAVWRDSAAFGSASVNQFTATRSTIGNLTAQTASITNLSVTNFTAPADSVGLAALTSASKAYDFAFEAGFANDGTAQALTVQNYAELTLARPVAFETALGNIRRPSTGASVQPDIKVDDVSIYAVKPEFLASFTTMSAGTLAISTAAAGSILSFSLAQVGSSTAGAQMSFTLKGRLFA